MDPHEEVFRYMLAKTGLICPHCDALRKRWDSKCQRCDGRLALPLRGKILMGMGAVAGGIVLALYWGLRAPPGLFTAQVGLVGQMIVGFLVGALGGTIVGAIFDRIVEGVTPRIPQDFSPMLQIGVILFGLVDVAGIVLMLMYCLS
jgi:hypothetical protein